MKALWQVPATRWILAALVLSLLTALLWRWASEHVVRRRFKSMRKPQEQKKPVYVRRTDLMKLTPQQERERRRALELIERRQVVEGARILESINLQREAVTALEESGHIDESCAVLLRLQRPNRAAAVYARHGMHAKAAEYFLIAKSPEEAANQYLEAAKADPACFEKAGQIFEAIPKTDAALKAYISGKVTQKVVSLGMQTEAWLDLIDFMSDKGNAKAAFNCMDTVQIKTFVEKIPIDQRTVQLLAMWSDLTRKTDFLAATLKRLAKHKAPLTNYWFLLPLDLAGQLCAALSKSVNVSTKEGLSFLTRNAHALYDAKRFPHAAGLYSIAGRHAMAGKCHALAGHLDHCLASLRQANDDLLVQKFEEAIAATRPQQGAAPLPAGTWHPDAIAAVCRALEYVDPDSDDVAARSPFSMVA